MRLAPGARGLLVALDAVLAGDDGTLGGAATAAARTRRRCATCDWLRDAGEDLVIVYGERALTELGARALLNLAARLGLSPRPGAGLLEVPSVPNARGIREAGFAPGHGPGYATLAERGRDAHGIAEASPPASCRPSGSTTPTRSATTRTAALWEKALGTAQTVIAVDTVLTDDRARVRGRRLPRRGVSREGGHGHEPRRARAAAAPGDRPPEGPLAACPAPACGRAGR